MMTTRRRRPPPILGLAAAIAAGTALDAPRGARHTTPAPQSTRQSDRPKTDNTPTPMRGANRRFTVSGLRAIEHAHVEHLARLTVFVGGNGSGKTTMLEALRIHASGGDPATLRHILGRDQVVSNVFHHHGFRDAMTAHVVLETEGEDGKRVSLHRLAAGTAHDVQIQHEQDMVGTVNLENNKGNDRDWPWLRAHIWIDRAGARTAAESRWRQITTSNRSRGPTGTLIVVDEFENGLHHTNLKRRWSDTLRYLDAHQAELATTTHSAECLRALAEASADQGFNDIRVVRLEPEERRTRTVAYDAEELRHAIREGIELR